MKRNLERKRVLLWLILTSGLGLLLVLPVAAPAARTSAMQMRHAFTQPNPSQAGPHKPPVIPAGVTPTWRWVDFRSQNTTVMGSPVAVGAIVRAFDPGDVQCAEFVVDHEGWYGLMPCYGDDPNTPGDEGAVANNPIHFTIDDQPALPMGPDAAVWTANGALKVVDLAVVAVTSTATPSVTPTSTSTPPGTIPAPTATLQVALHLPVIRR